MEGGRIYDAAGRWLGGGSFAAAGLATLLFYELLLLGLLVTPGGDTGMGAFAEEFRVWCFGYDPDTGRFDWGFLLGMLAPPALLGAIVAGLWWEPLRAVLARPRLIVRPAAAAAMLVSLVAGSFAFLGFSPPPDDFPFPAEALRTALSAPALHLTDQAHQPIDLADQRGKVVMLTAVYASCPHTCPRILSQAKSSIAALSDEERADLRVVAVTMDPEHDSPEKLAELAQMHELAPPLYHLVTGPPGEVGEVLDSMGIARQRDPETGIIDHANLFLLVDRGGKVAYRLTLGDRQERWLTSALRILLREPVRGG
jgi:protein SCO1/2